jgi:hypothetical protein
MKKLILLLAAIVVVLALLNPDEADFREYIRQRDGVAGSLGIAMADLFSRDKKGGIKRENYLIASRFYIGGDGLIPRQDLAWGFAGKFRAIEKTK